MGAHPRRLLGLLRAVETVTGDLSLELVLRNIIESALELVGARYGALGVIAQDDAEGRLERFIHVGISEDDAHRIGPLPSGKGLLGALIHDPHPIRLEHINRDSRSVGFPGNHPSMESFLGVPIHSRAEIFGNLYLADSVNGVFSEEDEELAVALALAAGTAVSNARLYRDAQLKQRWLEASVEIGAQLLASDGEDPLHLIARRAMDIADADLVSVALTTSDGESVLIEVAFGEEADRISARRFPLSKTLTRSVLINEQPLVLPQTNHLTLDNSFLAEIEDRGPAMVLPLHGGAQSRGTLMLMRREGRAAFSESEAVMAAGFASHASVALELAAARSLDQKIKLHEDRDRIARDLHDHVIQELFAIGISLEGAAAELRNDPAIARRLNQRVEDIDRTIRRIRTSIFDLRGNLGISSDGLSKRVLEVASDVAPALGFTPHVAFGGLVEIRLDDELTEDVVAVVRETLTNIAKHARATEANVDIALSGDELTITVTDDGVGIDGVAAAYARSSGTTNLRRRAERLGGSFELASGATGGTIARWRTGIR
ncbi:MAG TPA: GAF domain-containing protein [Jatrophihabitans sp.]